MRIAYLHQYFTTPEVGGGLRSYQFARRWVNQGHEVHVLCIGSQGGQRTGRWLVEDVEGITVHSLKLEYSNRMGFYRRLAAFSGYAVAASLRVLQLRPDAVYATSTPLTVAIPALVASARGTPYVFEVRDLWPDVPIALGHLNNVAFRASARCLERRAYRHAGHVIALAPGMREEILAKGTDPSKVSVIPQGCDTELFVDRDPRKVRQEHPWVGDGPVVLYAGAVGQANGLRYLVDLATAMRQVDPHVQFVVIGEGREKPDLEALARRRGILGRSIHFLGPRSKAEVADWMAASDMTLALLTGPRILWRDAVQNKFFDALAAQRPIATNNDGWQTQLAIAEGVGAMLDPTDTAQAARELAGLLSDQPFIAAVPANCRRLADGRFNRDAQAADALRIVTTVAERRGSAS